MRWRSCCGCDDYDGQNIEKKENEMYQGYIEFLAMMGVTLVWMAVMYLIAKLRGE